MNKKLIIAFSLLLSLVFAQTNTTKDDAAIISGNLEIYDGLVGGIGQGTIAVIIFAIVGLIICFFKDCTQTPSIMVAIGIILPLIVLAIIWGIPKQSLRSEDQKTDKLPTDTYRVRTGIFTFLILFVCIFVSLLMCFGKMATVTGTRVDSEQIELQNQKRVKNVQMQVRNEQQLQDGQQQPPAQIVDEEAKLGDQDENHGLIGSPNNGMGAFGDENGAPFGGGNYSNGFNQQPMFGEYNQEDFEMRH